MGAFTNNSASEMKNAATLEQQGYQIIPFTNTEVEQDIEGILQQIVTFGRVSG